MGLAEEPEKRRRSLPTSRCSAFPSSKKKKNRQDRTEKRTATDTDRAEVPNFAGWLVDTWIRVACQLFYTHRLNSDHILSSYHVLQDVALLQVSQDDGVRGTGDEL